MQSLKEVLRLKFEAKLSNRQIERLGLASRSAISNYVRRFEQSGLGIEEVLSMNASELASRLFPEQPSKPSSSRPQPDWRYVHEQLGRKGITRQLLWEEYKEVHPDGYGYTQFKEHYNRFVKTLNPSMRQIHYAGDKLFVDFSGLTMPIIDATSGEVRKAQIFVAVLGASGYTFVHAVMNQDTESFIACHNAAFAFYGGVPNQVVPDNLKAAVIANYRSKVRLNASYEDMARHYGVAIVPARPRKPQDKGKVEAGVKGIQRWILMKLRHRTFFDVDELNDAIGELLESYNGRIVKRLQKSRKELFEAFDFPALHPLPANAYLYREHKRCKVGVDYHIELFGSGYSAPYAHQGKSVDVWYSHNEVAIVLGGETIAVHPRLHEPHEDSTLIAHMPPGHRYQYEKWNPGRILNWAREIGPDTVELMKTIMKERSHPVRGYRSCMAILNFTKRYGNEALEGACSRALEIHTTSIVSIESMLKRKTYLKPTRERATNNTLFDLHENIRGAKAFQ